MSAEGSGPSAREAALLAENQRLRRQLAEAELLTGRTAADTAAAAGAQRAALASSRREATDARQEVRQARRDGVQAASDHRTAMAAGRAELAGSEALNAALQASEGRLRLILESATDFAIVTIDLDGHLTGCAQHPGLGRGGGARPRRADVLDAGGPGGGGARSRDARRERAGASGR